MSVMTQEISLILYILHGDCISIMYYSPLSTFYALELAVGIMYPLRNSTEVRIPETLQIK